MDQMNIPEPAQRILDRVDGALDQVGQWIEQGANVAAEQAPLVIREILNWSLAEAIVWLVIGLILLGFGLFMLHTALKK